MSQINIPVHQFLFAFVSISLKAAFKLIATDMDINISRGHDKIVRDTFNNVRFQLLKKKI